jgi:hypothetical protein
MGRTHDRENLGNGSYRCGAHMIVKTLGSTCLLLEICWQKGRQADKMCTCTHCLPTFLAADLIFSPCPLRQFVKTNSIHGKHLSE